MQPTYEELADAMAHECFVSLTQLETEWSLVYRDRDDKKGLHTYRDADLNRLLKFMCAELDDMNDRPPGE